MKRPVVFVGLIVFVLGFVLIFAGQDVLPAVIPIGGTIIVPTTTEGPENSGSTGYIQLFEVPTELEIPAPYSTLLTQIAYTPSSIGQEFTFTLAIRFPDQEFSGCLQGQICDIMTRTINSQGTVEEQIDLKIRETTLFAIPLVINAQVRIDSSVKHQYYLKIDSTDSFSHRSQTTIFSNLIVIIGLFITIVGTVLLVAGLIMGRGTGRKRSRPLPLQPAFEPTLGSGSQKSRGGSSRSSSSKNKSSKVSRGSSASARSSTSKCRSCNLPIPRNSQYCPHCYKRQ